jgi:hypothetical protein
MRCIQVEPFYHYGGQLVRSGREQSWTTLAATTFWTYGCIEVEERVLGQHWLLRLELIQLRRDMRWWISASNHDVEIVVLAKF